MTNTVQGRGRARLARIATATMLLAVGALTPVVLTSSPAAAAGSVLLAETFSGTSVPDPALVPLVRPA